MQNLSRQQTLQQERAASALKQVEAIDKSSFSDKQKKEYGSLARGFPAMIQIDGLGHALAFLIAKTESKGDNHHRQLYSHLGQWLGPRFGAGSTDILKWLTSQDSAVYRQVATEAVAYLMWIRRFVEAKGWKGEE